MDETAGYFSGRAQSLEPEFSSRSCPSQYDHLSPHFNLSSEQTQV